ncbi:MAG: DUF6714 family protein [Bacteroidota bacterium]
MFFIKSKKLMETDIAELKTAIHQAFAKVRLGAGVSWREADVIDDYGSAQARAAARAQDEQVDWSKIPYNLIGSLRYQSVTSFFDEEGFRFHLPIIMLYVLDEYQTSDSVIIGGLISRLTDKRGNKLRTILNEEQTSCVRQFLRLLKNEPEFSFYRKRMGAAAGSIWEPR